MIKWTTEQKRIFDTKGNVLVSASAGSGKTTVMVKRIIDLLLDDTPVENVLVLSYTIASAADMRAKIVAKLFDCARDEADNNIDVEKIRRQIDNISFADICTVDSFCNRIVHENFEVIGIDPSFRLMDEEETNYIRTRLVKEVLAEEHECDDEQYLKLIHRLSTVTDDKLLTELILKLYDSIYINPLPENFVEKIRQSVGFNEAEYRNTVLGYYHNLAYEFKDNIHKVALGADFSGSMDYKELVDVMLNNLEIILEVKNLNELYGAVNSFSEKRLSGGKRKHTIDTVTQSAIKSIRDSIASSIVDDVTKRFAPEGNYDIDEAVSLIDKLLSLVDNFKVKYDNYKENEGKRDFLDLSRYTIKLLENENKALEIASRFDYIFIDEYQDINPLQEVILQKISKSDNVFMVGDSKQSIYAFRNADTQIFLDKIALFNENTDKGTNCKLTQNFRSQLKILEFVDRLFNTVMTDNSCGLDYANESSFINNDTDFSAENMATSGSDVDIKLYSVTNDFPPVEINGIYSVKNHKEELNAETAVAYYEGLGITDKIKELVNDTKNKYKYSDIALLFRKRSKNAQIILRALRDSGIPYISDGFEGGQGTEIKKTLINLVRVLDNPYIDIAFAGHLLSYFGGFNENELLQIRQNSKGQDSLYSAVAGIAKSDNALSEKCSKALADIERWRAMAFYKNTSVLLNDIVAETGYDAYVLSQPAGKAEYHYMNNFISSISDEAMQSTHSFLRYYDNVQTREQYAPLDFGNAVKVITIHGSKGLEFPIVFLCQINESVGRKTQTDDVIVDRDIGVGTMIFARNTRAKYRSFAYNAIEINTQRRAVAENIRLFYVALTRAKDLLFISGTSSENTIETKTAFPEPLMLSNSFLDLLFYASAKDAGIKLMLSNPVNCSAIIRAPEINPPVVFNKAEKIYSENINKVLNYKYKYSDATKISPKYSVTELNKISEETDSYMPALVPSIDGRLRGIAYHRVMENIDFSLRTYAEVDMAIKNMVESGILLLEEANIVDRSEILDCLNSDLIKTALNGKIEREKPFMLNLPTCEVLDTTVTDDILIQGTVDLLIFGKENIVVDFKSSVKPNENLRKMYGKQLNLYVLAVETSYGIKIDKKYIYSFRERQFIEL